MASAVGVRQILPGSGPPVGVLPNLAWQNEEFVLAPGDTVVMYTDGIAEARRADGEPLGYDGLARLIVETEAATPSRNGADAGTGAWLDNLAARLNGRTGPPPDDDWTALLVQHAARQG